MGRSIEDILAFLRSLIGAVASSLRSNAGLAVLSVVLAFTLWIFVTDTEETRRSGVLPVDIPVVAVNVPPDVAVAEISPSQVQVRVDVREDVWDSLTVDDFEATVDLLNLPEGMHEVRVKVKPLRTPGNLRVTQVVPDPVEVALKPLFSRSVPLVVETVGSPLPGYEIGEPQPEVDEVIVSGPEELVSLVRTVAATVDVTGATGDVDRAFRLLARDGREQRVEGVVVEPSVINILLPIQRIVSELLVSPTIEGTPAEGYNVTGFSVDPPVATVVGTEQALAGVRVVPTQAVDIDDATEDVVVTVALDLPAGVSLIGSGDVRVTVRIAPALGQLPFQVALQVDGLASDLEVSSTLPTLQVTLSGEVLTLQTVRPEDIVAVLNLDELGEGTHTLEPEVQAPQGLTVVAVVPAAVEATLEATPEAMP